MPCDHFEPDKGLHSGKCARCGAWTTSFERFSRVTTLFGKSHAEVTTAQAVELDSDICLACFETCACFSPQNQIAYPSLRSDSGPTAGSCATVAVIGSDSACFEDCAARSLDMTSQISSSSSRTRGTTRNPAPSSLFRPQQGLLRPFLVLSPKIGATPTPFQFAGKPTRTGFSPARRLMRDLCCAQCKRDLVELENSRY